MLSSHNPMMTFHQNELYDDSAFLFGAVMETSTNLQFVSSTVLKNNNETLLSQEDEMLNEVSELIDLFNSNSWKSKAIETWTSEDVLYWLDSEANGLGVILHDLNGHNFATVNGDTLIGMTEEDFSKLVPKFGSKLYYRFQYLKTITGKPCSNQSLNTDRKFESNLSTTPSVVKRKPGRPKGSYRKDKREKVGLVWEFIRDLLLDPEYNPSHIRWENYEEGIFRFVRSAEVAKLWGIKKQNEKMDFGKFSRAIRQNYKNNRFEKVLKNRLVYKFGTTATGWKKTNPNFRRCS